MPGIVAGALVAHPPVLLPEVGGAQSERVRATAEAMHALDDLLAGVDANLLVVVSPHSPSSMTALPVLRGDHASGNLARFRAPRVALEADVENVLAAALIIDARRDGFALAWADESELDHGVIVPLSMLPRTRTGRRCLFLGVSGWPLRRFTDFGAWLDQRLRDRSAILIASGDLSHRLTPDAPYGFRSEGPAFDRQVIDALRDQAWTRIEGMDAAFIDQAGECGLRPLAIMLGGARAAGLRSRVLSYEGPFGVGYPVVAFTAGNHGLDIQDLGRRAIDTYLRSGHVIEPPEPIPPELQAPSAVFVTLRKNGDMRGCVGTMVPTQPTAAHELIRYAVRAATRDLRFQPVRFDEVEALTITAQFIDPPEPVTDLAALDPRTYGIIVRSGARQALLLPDLESIRTAEQQLQAACDKAGIGPLAPLTIERFRTRTLP